jgi:hypothetical protein
MSKEFESLFAAAIDAGRSAGANAKCIPMTVGSAKSIFSNEIDHDKPTYYVADGVCGFASVTGIKGNTAFGRWLLKTRNGRTGYPSGVFIKSPIISQSLTRNEEACCAIVKVLSAAGITCYMSSRMD